MSNTSFLGPTFAAAGCAALCLYSMANGDYIVGAATGGLATLSMARAFYDAAIEIADHATAKRSNPESRNYTTPTPRN